MPQRQHLSVTLESTTIPNLEAVKARQKATWESGDFGQIARTIENVAEEFMARQPLRPGAHVLDVACGTGNLAVIAARARLRGQRHRHREQPHRARPAPAPLRKVCASISRKATPRRCPSLDGQFDLVVSMFGVMFTPRPNVARRRTAARDKARRADRVGQLDARRFHRENVQVFKAHLPPPPAGVPSPMGWGDEDHGALATAARLQSGAPHPPHRADALPVSARRNGRVLPPILWPDAKGLRLARCLRSSRAAARPG